MSFFDILDFIVSAIADAVSFIVSVIDSVVQAIVNVFNFFAGVIGNIIQFLLDFPSHLKDFLDDLWNEVIVPGWEKIQQIWDDITTKLHDIFDPIISIIEQLRAWFYKYIYPWIQLAQQILSSVRVILSALRILGVKWAAKLDADIQRIQSYITTGLQTIVGTLNSVSTWLNVALDPFGIIRKDFFSASSFANLGTIRHAVTFGDNRYLTASEAANTDGDRSLVGGGAAVLTRNADGSVTYSDASKRINAGYDTAWKEYGGTTGLP